MKKNLDRIIERESKKLAELKHFDPINREIIIIEEYLYRYKKEEYLFRFQEHLSEIKK